MTVARLMKKNVLSLPVTANRFSSRSTYRGAPAMSTHAEPPTSAAVRAAAANRRVAGTGMSELLPVR